MKKNATLKLIRFCCICTMLACFLTLGSPGNVYSQQNKRYNVLLIFIDDMNEKTNYLGYPEVLTPNLQRLIKRGVAFTSAYCQFAICNPSRTSMMSGWRPDKTGVWGNDMDPAVYVPSNVHYLQDYLHSFGYRTERYGKIYHGQFELEFTWDHAEGRDRSALALQSLQSAASSNSQNNWGIFDGDGSIGELKRVQHLITSMQTKRTQPVFFAIGLGVHSPFTPNITDWNVYGDPSVQVDLPVWKSTKTIQGNSSANIALPNTPKRDRKDVPAVAFFANKQDIKPDSIWQRAIQAYYAEVYRMDRHLGMILDEMDKDNLWRNTVVVFVSDHGQHLGEHDGTWLKNTLFKESLHVPLIVAAPGMQAATCDKFVEMVDIYPTITELCKVPTPDDVEGSSFVRLLADPTQPWKQIAFSQTWPGPKFPLVSKCESLFTNRYHYNYWGTYGEELYDRQNDPFEYTNQATNPNFANTLAKMRNLRELGWQNAKPPACDTVVYYADNDGDGYGDNSKVFMGCYQPLGYVTVGGDCNDSDALVTTNCFAVKVSTSSAVVKEDGYYFSVYPTFPKDNIVIQYKAGNNEKVYIKIFNAAGQQMLLKNENAFKGLNTYQIQVGNLIQGMYFVELSNNNSANRSKIIIQK